MEHVECVVVGAGVVGLAVARSLAQQGHEVIILEAAEQIGTEVSSRNSGVIHAGIYYPQNSVKARVCVAGKHALYAFCESHGVPHARCTKLIVATDDKQRDALLALRERAARNGVDDLQLLSAKEATELEPALSCTGALLSPSTGIVDVHEYMLALQGDAEASGAVVALRTTFVRGRATSNGIELTAGRDEPMTLRARFVINCAALGAQQVAASIEGIDAQSIPRLYYAKGNYFALSGPSPFARLIYPMPSDAWLGVHVGLDLAGRCKFGPDIHWVDALNYDVDVQQSEAFYSSIRRYWPGLPDDALHPDYTGIRPKLYPQGEPARDFEIQTDATHGVRGLVNLFGIESPGLTSSLAVGAEVAALVRVS